MQKMQLSEKKMFFGEKKTFLDENLFETKSEWGLTFCRKNVGKRLKRESACACACVCVCAHCAHDLHFCARACVCVCLCVCMCVWLFARMLPLKLSKCLPSSCRTIAFVLLEGELWWLSSPPLNLFKCLSPEPTREHQLKLVILMLYLRAGFDSPLSNIWGNYSRGSCWSYK